MTDSAGANAFTFRRLVPGEEEALLPVWNRAARFDPCSLALMQEKISHDAGFDPDLTAACEGPDGLCGFAVAVVRPSPGRDPAGFIKLLAVTPEWRRRGIGSRLLAMVENELLDRGVRTVRVAESAPNYLSPGIDLRYTAAPGFLVRHGYRATAQALNMTVALGDRPFVTEPDEKRLASNGIEARRATREDLPGLEMLLAAFGGSWLAEVSNSLQRTPVLVHVASREERLIGFAASEGNNAGTAWFGPMGTLEEARGLGIGRVLLYRCLNDLEALGHRQAIIPWVAPVSFYEQHAGAVVSRRFQRYEKEIDR